MRRAMGFGDFDWPLLGLVHQSYRTGSKFHHLVGGVESNHKNIGHYFSREKCTKCPDAHENHLRQYSLPQLLLTNPMNNLSDST